MRVDWGDLWLKTTRTKHIQRERERFQEVLEDYLNKEGASTSSPSIDALVERSSLRYGVPKEIIRAIIHVESGFNPMAYNKNKDGTEDRGIMQVNYQHNLALMKEYGINDPDQLYDPAINIEIGTRILYENYKRFGNWVMAIKAYNGINADNWDYVRKVLQNAGRLKEFSEK
ncbi:lytic transglycosylase domain-containing protein [Thermocrinis sp.]